MGLEQFFGMQVWCLDIRIPSDISDFYQICGVDIGVTDLFVWLIYKFCAILPTRLWSRSFIDTWAMELD